MCLSIGETDVSKQTKFRLFLKLKAQERKGRCGGVGVGVGTGDVEVLGGSGHERWGGVEVSGWKWAREAWRCLVGVGTGGMEVSGGSGHGRCGGVELGVDRGDVVV